MRVAFILAVSFCFVRLAYSDVTPGRQLWTDPDGDPNLEPFYEVTVSSGTMLDDGDGTATLTTGGGGGSPGGSGSEIQYRSDATTFGAVTNSSVSGANIVIAGDIESSAAIPTIKWTDSAGDDYEMYVDANIGYYTNVTDGRVIWRTDQSNRLVAESGVVIPGSSDTQVFFRDGDVIGYDGNLRWNRSSAIFTVGGSVSLTTNTTPTARALYTENQAAANKAAALLDIYAGLSTGSANGAALQINAGHAQYNGTGAGGELVLSAGYGSNSSNGTGGSVSIYATDAGLGKSTPGYTGIASGTGSGAGGSVTLYAGSGGYTSGNGGVIELTAGNASSTGSGNGGNVNIAPGTATVSGSGGSVVISSADGAGTNKAGGSFTINLGKSTGSGGGSLFQIARSTTTGITAALPILEITSNSTTLADGTTVANWRHHGFNSPTINGVAGGGTETVTTASTVYIDAAPSGSNITLSNGPYALFVDGGASRFDGDIESQATTPRVMLTDTTTSEDDFELVTDGDGAYFADTTDGVIAWALNTQNSLKLGEVGKEIASLSVHTTATGDMSVQLPLKSIGKSEIDFPNTEFTRCTYIENLAAGDDNISMGSWDRAVTIKGLWVNFKGTGTTTGTIALEDGSGNAMTHSAPNPVAEGTIPARVSVTVANQLTALEMLRFDVTNSISPETDEYTICVAYTYDS